MVIKSCCCFLYEEVDEFFVDLEFFCECVIIEVFELLGRMVKLV